MGGGGEKPRAWASGHAVRYVRLRGARTHPRMKVRGLGGRPLPAAEQDCTHTPAPRRACTQGRERRNPARAATDRTPSHAVASLLSFLVLGCFGSWRNPAQQANSRNTCKLIPHIGASGTGERALHMCACVCACVWHVHAWCGVVWCGVVRCSVWCGVVWRTCEESKREMMRLLSKPHPQPQLDMENTRTRLEEIIQNSSLSQNDRIAVFK